MGQLVITKLSGIIKPSLVARKAKKPKKVEAEVAVAVKAAEVVEVDAAAVVEEDFEKAISE